MRTTQAVNVTPGYLALLLVPVLALAVAPASAVPDAEWELEREADKIRIYTRPVSGSPYLEVKATTLINARLERVTQALGDGSDCGEWRSMCKSSEIIDTVSDTEHYVYLVLDMPWPLSDRDLVIRSIALTDPETRAMTVQLASASQRHPASKYVRAETAGSYEVRAVADDQVEFTYTLHTDLGGNLSPNMINSRLVASTLEDVKKLRLVAEGP